MQKASNMEQRVVVSHTNFETVVPKPTLPSPEQFVPIEKFVQDAILSRHAPPPPSNAVTLSSSSSTGMATYKALLDVLRSGTEEDPTLLSQVLLAMMYNNQGIPLKCIVSENERHKMLLQYIFKINPFKIVPKSADPTIPADKSAVATAWTVIHTMEDTLNTRDTTSRKDLNLMDIYLHFLVTLVSANSTFLSSTLETLWKLLLQITRSLQDKEDDEGEKDVNHSMLPQKDEEETSTPSHENLQWSILKLHTTLAKILHLVPKGKTELYSILSSSFPYKLAPVDRQVSYLQQTLVCIQNYLSTAHASFLELWLDKCLEMDVEIRIEEDGRVRLLHTTTDEKKKGEEEEEEEVVPQEEKKEEQILDSLKKSVIEKVDEMTTAEKMHFYMANKLDAVMLILFQHVSDSSYTLSPQTLYTMILPSFDSSILMTHRSKFVQFVFFLLCGLDADLRQFGHALPPSWTLHHASLFREFTAKLLDVALDTHKDTTTRQSAICYLASFVSRASYVNSETVCETVSTLLQFAEIYMDHFPNEASVRNAWKTSPCGMLGSPLNTSMDKTTMVEMHSLFYTVSQAVFYIMCFRGKECIQYYKQAQVYHDQQMENTDPTRKDYDAGSFADLDTVNVSSERWNRLCAHHLQPLRYCLETVRGEFLLLAHAFHLVDGELLQRLIMEDRKMATPIESSTSVATISPNIKKKATSIRTAATLEKSRLNGGVGGLGRGSNPLQSFFPFDPYLLCKSHKFIEKYYKHWTGSCVPDEEEDSEDESEESVELAEEVEDGLNEDSYDDENDGSTSDEEEEEEVESQTDTDEDLDTFPQDLLDNRNKAHLQNRKRPRVGSMTSNTDYSDLSASKRPRFGSMNSYTDASDPGISLSREEWVQELKRSRALSISITDECW